MQRLICCEYCGKVTQLTRSDKHTCSNNCAVRLIYSRKHSYQTPLEQYIKLINEGGIAHDDFDDNNEVAPIRSEGERPILRKVDEKPNSGKTPSNLARNNEELDAKLKKINEHIQTLKTTNNGK